MRQLRRQKRKARILSAARKRRTRKHHHRRRRHRENESAGVGAATLAARNAPRGTSGSSFKIDWINCSVVGASKICDALPPLIEHVRGLTGSVYGRRMYEVMRYWDEDRPEWDAEERDFAAAWRSQPKWVVSRSLKSVGPNATLVEDDIEAVIRGLKARLVGEIEVAGPDLAGSLTDLGLIDEYRLYLHPVVLGRGKPFFAGPRPPLRLVTGDRIAGDVMRLTYAPA